MTGKFGKIEQVNVREHWANEATDFTPWLARDDNIGKLGDALGLELEVENTEVAVGPYSADIVAKDTVNGKYVVIENMLGKINHDHLGKIITYGATLDASTLVLVATEFTEEHQKALEWLNEHSSDDLGFFGVRLELWKIDDSRPAVRFTVLSRPSTGTRKAAKATAKEDVSPTRKLQLEFWTEFEKRLRERPEIPSTQSPRPQYWFNVALGRSGIHLSCVANTWEKWIGVRVYIAHKDSDAVLEQLLLDKDQIEKEIGESLRWNPHPDKMHKVIMLDRKADLEKREQWDDYLGWMVQTTLKFRGAFSKRVKDLKL